MMRSRVPALLGWVIFAGATGSLAQSGESSDYSSRGIVFFPPVAPVYGAPLDDRSGGGVRLLRGLPLRPPDGLANFVNEDFYPALSSRLFVPELKRELESRIHAYRARRLNHVTDLLNQFVTLYQVTAEERDRQLREFAAIQTPHLVALEAEGERLREELVGRGFGNVDWNSGRKWKLGTVDAKVPWAQAEAEFQIVRAAVFYQSGLVSQQRGLMREVAFELQQAARKARGSPSARSESDAMFFSPETARFRLPASMASSLREKVAAYNGQKALLKRELRQAVIDGEGKSAGDRRKAFEALADRQWPHLRGLEEMADDIRWLLAPGFEVPPPPPPPWMPAGLMEAIRSYNEDRDSYFGDLKLYADGAAAMVTRLEGEGTSDNRIQEERDYAARRAETRRLAALEFQERHAIRFAGLQQRYKAIREGLAVVAEKQIDRKTGRPLDADTLLRQYGASMAEFETFGRESTIYAHYRIAMLQPGLSPEQRRLLFGYSLVGLAQALPGGEVMPRRGTTRPFASY